MDYSPLLDGEPRGAPFAAVNAHLRQEAQSNPVVAKRLVGSLSPTGSDPAEVATWVALARVIINLDEFVTRE